MVDLATMTEVDFYQQNYSTLLLSDNTVAGRQNGQRTQCRHLRRNVGTNNHAMAEMQQALPIGAFLMIAVDIDIITQCTVAFEHHADIYKYRLTGEIKLIHEHRHGTGQQTAMPASADQRPVCLAMYVLSWRAPASVVNLQSQQGVQAQSQ